MITQSYQPKKLIFLILIIICSSCTTIYPTSSSILTTPPSDRVNYSAEPEDFFGVYFKPNQPSLDDDLMSSLSDTLGGAEHALDHDLKIISTFPQDTRLRVVGFTDSEECTGQECVELSQRRAQSVHDWLISHGISVARLDPPYGYGSARPIGDNTTESGRARNRRAYISDESIH